MAPPRGLNDNDGDRKQMTCSCGKWRLHIIIITIVDCSHGQIHFLIHLISTTIKSEYSLSTTPRQQQDREWDASFNLIHRPLRHVTTANKKNPARRLSLICFRSIEQSTNASDRDGMWLIYRKNID